MDRAKHGRVFVLMEGGGEKGKKEIWGTVMDMCYSDGPVNVH
jgi:hypothetical protein